ncbi:phytoene dehydrogenase-like protein [Microbacterium endophyticum]|uniref:Phytoene dehydrogenase-like protein n=2 Tax=Microbacterium endophyticum TaxID=1526412 RepID=A0A7W4V5B7_9MICO|nr:NAD(P)/FAD-dependent oxidoreductase [Microbacterium endophyticum]MBB2976565.1 phytoene dehydrogenase-like protein [Microbacterium endophyticum]NIK36011.1 phytoene dehydrogenase-like protein [Microbacterium endophyticum]
MPSSTDANVVGSGPNGLAAAVTLARAGYTVRVYEKADTIGGSARTLPLTQPGFQHDLGSAVHPLALASPFFRAFGLASRIDLRVPDISFAHPIVAGRSAVAYRSLDHTASQLGRDGRAYRRLLAPLVAKALEIARFTGSPLLQVPETPGVAAQFGLRSLQQGTHLWNAGFRDEDARALLSGAAAHTILPLPSLASAAAGLALTTHAHAGGWPVPVGGSQAIIDALVADLEAHGGTVITGVDVHSLDDLPASEITILDVTPRAFVALAGDRMPPAYRRSLARFRYGNGVAKVDFALRAPVPWTDPVLRNAPTLHLGGTRAQIARAEDAVARGGHPASPYVLVSQPSVLDSTRAPAGAATLWAYTHVPAGSTLDRREAVVTAIERFAPGFRDVIIDAASLSAAQVEASNPNLIGGDIGAGAPTLSQLIARPRLARDPWRTPLDGVYLCGASTAPGPGVHGLSGWYAAQSALRTHAQLGSPDLLPREK